jgi:hypothetical protein
MVPSAALEGLRSGRRVRLLWRLWAFLSGLPLGALVALVAAARPGPMALAAAALASGGAFVAAVSLIARRDGEPDRGRHLAAAASVGWCALPAGFAAFFDWAPGGPAWAASAGVATAVALFAGSRAPGPAGGALRWALRALAASAGGFAIAVAVASAWAALAARDPEPSARFTSVLHSIDATVVTRPLPACDGAPRAVQVLAERGAHPVLAPDDRSVFFDAASQADGGRRQIHRLDREGGELVCLTCGEPGNNVRPSVSTSGVSMVYETDRHATWRHPDDSEFYLAAVKPRGAKGDPGRRLSFSPGPDSRPVFGPGPQMVTWSRREHGRYRVVAASIRSGHGGILLGTQGLLADGGAEWIAPVAWSADGRTLVVARGNPFAALSGALLDPTTGQAQPLGDDLAPAAGANGDGAWLAFATTRSSHAAGALPRLLGFALGPWAAARDRFAPLRHETGVRAGPTASPADAQPLALGDALSRWGEPTGLALASDASGIVLGQRRRDGAEVQERLLWVELDCARLATPPRAVEGAPR